MKFQGQVTLLLPDGTQRVDALPEIEALNALQASDLYADRMRYGVDEIIVIGINVAPAFNEEQFKTQVLALRDLMNDRCESPNGRLLFIPPNTGFTQSQLHGFEVRVVDKPLALGAMDFPNVYRFAIKRNDAAAEARPVGHGPAGFIDVEDPIA